MFRASPLRKVELLPVVPLTGKMIAFLGSQGEKLGVKKSDYSLARVNGEAQEECCPTSVARC